MGLIILLIVGSFLPIINGKIVNNDVKSDDNKQLIFQINFNEISEVIIVDKKDGNKDFKELYQSSKYLSKQSTDSDGYIIITTDDLKDTVISSDFIEWKTSIGFDVKIVSISDTEIRNQPGFDLAEQIRNFLREYYIEWSIKYVLLCASGYYYVNLSCHTMHS